MYPPPLSLPDFASKDLDYLVVGGGTAGLVVAARLSEIPEFQIGVIEAGPTAFDRMEVNRPGLFGLTMGSEYDWKFESAPQPALGGRRLTIPRGRVLGGTSVLNYMAWARGSRADYEGWAELGNPGWSWDEILFVRFEP